MRNESKVFSELTKEEKNNVIRKNYHQLIRSVLDTKAAGNEWNTFLEKEAKKIGFNTPGLKVYGDFGFELTIMGSPGGPIQTVNTLIEKEMEPEKLEMLKKAKGILEVLLTLKKEGQKFEITWEYETLNTVWLFSIMRLEEIDVKIVKENTKNKEILKDIRKKELLEIYSNANYLLTEKIVCNFLDDMDYELHEFYGYLKSKIRKLMKELEERISLFSSTENVRKILNERKDIKFYSDGTLEKKNYKRRN